MNKISAYINLSQEEIDIAKQKCFTEWETNLQQYGIIFPKEDTAKYYQLIYLYHFMGSFVSKEAITQFVQSKIPTASGDQQVRHLAGTNGYNVMVKGDVYNDIKTPSGYYCLINMTMPKQSWLNKKNFRIDTVTISDFDKLKKHYHYCCATCGAKEGEEHKYYSGTVELQKGHMNPNLPLEEGNIIPQCQYCNRDIYKDNFVFNEQGRPVSINNPSYILKSSESVQEEMYKLLKAKFEKYKKI